MGAQNKNIEKRSKKSYKRNTGKLDYDKKIILKLDFGEGNLKLKKIIL